MKTIRQGSFETNSSSSHSISTFAGQGERQTLTPNADGQVVIGTDEFGWDWFKLETPMEKLRYIHVDIRGDEDSQEMLREAIMEECPTVKEVIFADNACASGGDYHPDGYIDHQSVGTTCELFVSKQTVKDFVFFEGGIIFGGNDNSEPPPGFHDTKFDNKVYTREVWLDRFPDQTAKLTEDDNVAEVVNNLFEYCPLYKYRSKSMEETIAQITSGVRPVEYEGVRNQTKLDKNIFTICAESKYNGGTKQYDESGFVELKFTIKEL